MGRVKSSTQKCLIGKVYWLVPRRGNFLQVQHGTWKSSRWKRKLIFDSNTIIFGGSMLNLVKWCSNLVKDSEEFTQLQWSYVWSWRILSSWLTAYPEARQKRGRARVSSCRAALEKAAVFLDWKRQVFFVRGVGGEWIGGNFVRLCHSFSKPLSSWKFCFLLGMIIVNCPQPAILHIKRLGRGQIDI